jgi:hypothetical protein
MSVYVGSTYFNLGTGSAVDQRAMLQEIVNALTACGLIQTGDTGQSNLATYSYGGGNPSAFQTGSGNLLMFRFNDALQATAPIFLRMRFFSKDNGGNWFASMDAHIGSGSNGGGGLTGVVGTEVNAPYIGRRDGYVMASGDGSSVYVFWTTFPGAAVVANMLMIERTRNPDGTPNGDGAFFLLGQSSTFNAYLLDFRAGVAGAVRGWFPAIDPSLGRSNIGMDMAISPAVLACGKPEFILPAVCGGAGDIPPGNLFDINYLGRSRQYRAMGDVVDVNMLPVPRVSGQLILPWEP